MNTIGDNIRKYRQERGLTQKMLGLICFPEIAESTIRRYELGKLNPKKETLQKIALALEVPLSALDESISSEIKIDGASMLIAKLHIERKVSAYYGELAEGLLIAFDHLNEPGKHEAFNYVSDMADNPKYQAAPPDPADQ